MSQFFVLDVDPGALFPIGQRLSVIPMFVHEPSEHLVCFQATIYSFHVGVGAGKADQQGWT